MESNNYIKCENCYDFVLAEKIKRHQLTDKCLNFKDQVKHYSQANNLIDHSNNVENYENQMSSISEELNSLKKVTQEIRNENQSFKIIFNKLNDLIQNNKFLFLKDQEKLDPENLVEEIDVKNSTKIQYKVYWKKYISY